MRLRNSLMRERENLVWKIILLASFLAQVALLASITFSLPVRLRSSASELCFVFTCQSADTMAHRACKKGMKYDSLARISQPAHTNTHSRSHYLRRRK
jgi:hypothetical protein